MFIYKVYTNQYTAIGTIYIYVYGYKVFLHIILEDFYWIFEYIWIWLSAKQWLRFKILHGLYVLCHKRYQSCYKINYDLPWFLRVLNKNII